MIAPATFIALAEETGPINEIDKIVLREDCWQVCLWQREWPDLKLSVNTSSHEIHEPGYANLVATLASSGLDARSLEIEITESVFLENPDGVREVLLEIQALGASVALDDFGTGYSSLSYLDKYKVDTIKIDRSSVTRMMHHKRTLAVIRTIIELGRDLNLDVIAERIEDEAQALALRELGCGALQGFLLGYPVSGLEVSAFLYDWALFSDAASVASAQAPAPNSWP